MSSSEPVRIAAGRWTLEGSSRAGVETWFRVRELGIAFDIGRCPDELVAIPHVFVTHAHIDHAFGIPYYAAQRTLQRMPPGKVYVPEESADGIDRLMRLHEQIEGTTYELELHGVARGDEFPLRRDLLVRVHDSSHRLPARGYEVIEVRHRLRPELSGVAGPRLAEMRAMGRVIEDRTEVPLLYYTGDTDAGCFDQGSAAYRAEVLVVECSFLEAADRDRARQWQHMHFDDIAERADRFENTMIVLTHFSLRYREADIHGLITKRCPERLRERIRLALPEPWMTLGGGEGRSG